MQIRLRTGITLEATLTENRTDKLAILLHPWSWLGGQMHDSVVANLAESLHDSKAYSIMKFNSRGVGESTGRASFTGLSEADDLRALVDWCIERYKDIQDIVIIGYSHGGLIASLLEPSVNGVSISHILVSYPLSPRPWLTLFNSSTYETRLHNLIRDPRSRVLIVVGDKDEFTGEEKYKSWLEGLEKLVDPQRTTLKIEQVRGATHFWRGQDGRQLSEIVTTWVP